MRVALLVVAVAVAVVIPAHGADHQRCIDVVMRDEAVPLHAVSAACPQDTVAALFAAAPPANIAAAKSLAHGACRKQHRGCSQNVLRLVLGAAELPRRAAASANPTTTATSDCTKVLRELNVAKQRLDANLDLFPDTTAVEEWQLFLVDAALDAIAGTQRWLAPRLPQAVQVCVAWAAAVAAVALLFDGGGASVARRIGAAAATPASRALAVFVADGEAAAALRRLNGRLLLVGSVVYLASVACVAVSAATAITDSFGGAGGWVLSAAALGQPGLCGVLVVVVAAFAFRALGVVASALRRWANTPGTPAEKAILRSLTGAPQPTD